MNRVMQGRLIVDYENKVVQFIATDLAVLDDACVFSCEFERLPESNIILASADPIKTRFFWTPGNEVK